MMQSAKKDGESVITVIREPKPTTIARCMQIQGPISQSSKKECTMSPHKCTAKRRTHTSMGGGAQSWRSVPFFSSSRYCPIASTSCPALWRYPARTVRSACGSKSASLSTCRSNSGVVSGTVGGGAGVVIDRWNNELRRALRLRL